MIEVNNLTDFKVRENFLKKVAQKVLANEGKNKTELSIALVGPKRIKELNKKYRKKDRITDTLSFAYNNSGEIVICPQEVKKNAKRFDSTFKKELTRALIHGILHLLGYNHELRNAGAKKVEETRVSSSPFVAARVMEEKQEYYLSLIKS
jgi:probable rRNA maturation factor